DWLEGHERARENYVGALRVAEQRAAPDDAELDRGTLMRSLGIELRAHGHERAAASVIERAAAWYRALPGERVTENTRWGLARAEYLSGRIDEGRRVLATLRAERPERLDYLGFEGVLAARGGDRARARDISRQLADLKGPYVRGENTYWRAAIATGLGDGAAALDLLEAARSEGYGLGVRLHAEPLFEPLWDAPAYQALIVARR
ncbi:MAG TPA: hypothetical protein VK849_02970, partial [Longimicrobiales bacterium]|nr:hypothetical protein [Longimicrobiales bacterium]